MNNEGWKHPTNEPTGIENGEKIESEVWRSADDSLSVDGDVELWCI